MLCPSYVRLGSHRDAWGCPAPCCAGGSLRVFPRSGCPCVVLDSLPEYAGGPCPLLRRWLAAASVTASCVSHFSACVLMKGVGALPQPAKICCSGLGAPHSRAAAPAAECAAVESAACWLRLDAAPLFLRRFSAPTVPAVHTTAGSAPPLRSEQAPHHRAAAQAAGFQLPPAVAQRRCVLPARTSMPTLSACVARDALASAGVAAASAALSAAMRAVGAPPCQQPAPAPPLRQEHPCRATAQAAEGAAVESAAH